MEELNVQENHLGNVIHKDVPSLVVGLIGKFVVKPVELEHRRERVQIQHQQMEELNVLENQLKIATHKDVPLLVLGLIGEYVVKPVELERRQELVQIRHH